MDNPKLYSKSNSLQAKLTVDILSKYWSEISWRKNEKLKVIDIGSGTGNVTAEILYPLLPSSVEVLLGVDISINMVESARRKYLDESKIEFDLLNIANNIPTDFEENFDSVFSFFCLHWVKNQRLAMKNIFTLLKPGGNTFFLFVGNCDQVFKNYVEMQKDRRWKKYMADVNNFLPPYQDYKEPEEIMRENMENAGFIVHICENLPKEFVFNDDQSLKDFLESVNPFVNRMTENDKHDYMNIYVERVKQQDPKKFNNGPTTIYLNILTAYAKKPN